MGLFERFRKKQQEDLGFPAKQWFSQWEVLKERTRSPVDLNAYFAEPEIAGKVLAVMDIGPCSVPSGRLLVRDPLASLGRREERLRSGNTKQQTTDWPLWAGGRKDPIF